MEMLAVRIKSKGKIKFISFGILETGTQGAAQSPIEAMRNSLDATFNLFNFLKSVVVRAVINH